MRWSGSARAVSIRIGTCDSVLSERAKSMPDSCGIIQSRIRQVEGEAAHAGARARRVDRRGHAEAVVLQIARQQIADAAIVVDDENMRRVVVGTAAMRLERRRHGHQPSPLLPAW